MNKELFVQNVKKACAAKGIKPAVALRESGLDKSFINSVEKGSTPSVDKVLKLANYLGWSIDELLGEDIKKELTPVSGSEPLYPPKYDLLSPAQKEIVDRLIEDLAKHQSAD